MKITKIRCIMSTMVEIRNFIKQIPLQKPITTDDIYEHVRKKLNRVDRAVITTYLSRIIKEDAYFKRFKKGIYYKSATTSFGLLPMDEKEYLVRQYLVDKGIVIGYESGPSIIQKIGLTTQMTKNNYIVTNKVNNTRFDERNCLYLIAPLTRITPENYRYLQLLDVLDNKYNVNIENEELEYKIYGEFIRKNNLRMERLLQLSLIYRNKKRILEKLAYTSGELI